MAICTLGLFSSSLSIWCNVNTLYVLLCWPSISSNASLFMNIACRPWRSFALLCVNDLEGYMSLMLLSSVLPILSSYPSWKWFVLQSKGSPTTQGAKSVTLKTLWTLYSLGRSIIWKGASPLGLSFPFRTCGNLSFWKWTHTQSSGLKINFFLPRFFRVATFELII